MLSTKLGLIFAILATTTYISISSVDAASCDSYGQTCNNLTTDNTTLWLTCQNPNQTQCGCFSGMHWSQAENRCLAKVGQPCYTALEDGRPLKVCTQDAECYPIKSSSSPKEYRCYCSKPMTVGDEDGYCKSTHEGSCNNDLDCLHRAALTCNQANQTCVCDFPGEGHQVWDASALVCGSLIGGSCNVSATNYVNQTCLAANSDCISGACNCKTGFTLHDGVCAVDYNNTCTANSDCGPTLICQEEAVVNTTTVKSRLFNSSSKIPSDTLTLLSRDTRATSKCLCNETLSIYDPNTKTCRTLPDKCNPAGVNSTSNCIPNSELQLCTDNEGHSGFTCSCSAGYQADNNSCRGLYNTSCSAPTDCYEKEFLGCSANKCECKQGYKYNAGTKKCIADLGQQCYNNEYCNESAGATCQADKCECRAGYSQKDVGGSKICVGTSNSTCTPTLPCDDSLFLKCQGGKCVCGPDYLWFSDAGKTQCWGLSGGVCGSTGIGACATNSTCVAAAENNATSICKCSSGFVENEAKLCTSGATSIQMTGLFSILFAILVAIKN